MEVHHPKCHPGVYVNLTYCMSVCLYNMCGLIPGSVLMMIVLLCADFHATCESINSMLFIHLIHPFSPMPSPNLSISGKRWAAAFTVDVWDGLLPLRSMCGTACCLPLYAADCFRCPRCQRGSVCVRTLLTGVVA